MIKNPKQEIIEKTTGTPFADVEEAWFWFVQAQQARNEGARIRAGLSTIERPCEPADILKILDRLYRHRMLLRDHLLVLRHYGRRQYAPDPYRVKEERANFLWHEAFKKMEPIFIRKGIVRDKVFGKKTLTTPHPNKYWVSGATVHSCSREMAK